MKKELLFDERSNSRVWEIEALEDLNSLVYSIGDDDTCYYKNYTFKVKRVNNDVYGNPLYKFVLCKDFENITSELKGLVYRAYSSKGYALIQSYNLSNSIESIFNKIDK